MAARATILILVVTLAACSPGASGEPGDAGPEDRSAEGSESAAFPLDGSAFGARASALAKAGDHPRPAAWFEPTDDEVAAIGAELAREFPPDAVGRREPWSPERPPPAFRAARVDLDGDGVEEILTLFAHPFFCGSGGCTFRVYSTKGGDV